MDLRSCWTPDTALWPIKEKIKHWRGNPKLSQSQEWRPTTEKSSVLANFNVSKRFWNNLKLYEDLHVYRLQAQLCPGVECNWATCLRVDAIWLPINSPLEGLNFGGTSQSTRQFSPFSLNAMSLPCSLSGYRHNVNSSHLTSWPYFLLPWSPIFAALLFCPLVPLLQLVQWISFLNSFCLGILPSWTPGLPLCTGL